MKKDFQVNPASRLWQPLSAFFAGKMLFFDHKIDVEMSAYPSAPGGFAEGETF